MREMAGMGMHLLDGAMVLVSILLLIPACVLALQVLAASRRSQAPESEASTVRPRVAVLMPAHNESAGIVSALNSVRSQLRAGDRLLVVADNCSDDTASVAAAAGAEVVERHDDTRRGKGYALDFGVRHLDADPPDIGIIVDADCSVAPGAIDRLAHQCARTGRTAQALYLMHSPEGAGLKTRLAELAWIVKNQVRPLGSLSLGLPCQLMGTGMAFPWASLRTAPLATGHIVEDVKLGLDLASVGAAPMFCPQALVTSQFPSQADGLVAQRTRWEHGHLGMILSHGPTLLWRAVVERRWSLIAMVVDLCVPPLASLVLAMIAWLGLSAVYWAAGGAALPLVIAGAALILLTLSILLAWSGFGRHVLSLGELLAAPGYALSKLPVYLRFWRKRQVEWVRTERDDKPR